MINSFRVHTYNHIPHMSSSHIRSGHTITHLISDIWHIPQHSPTHIKYKHTLHHTTYIKYTSAHTPNPTRYILITQTTPYNIYHNTYHTHLYINKTHTYINIYIPNTAHQPHLHILVSQIMIWIHFINTQ